MPDFTTHLLFGESIKDSFSPHIRNIIRNNTQAFNWGLQGPDILFYSKFYRNTGKVPRCGSLMHHMNSESLFSEVIGFLLNSKSSTTYQCLLSYFYGFLCHYVLDSTIHPYVYYLLYKINSQRLKTLHIQIESEIGVLMLKELYNCKIGDFKIYDYYNSDGDFIEPISSLYVYLIKELFDKTVNEKEISCSFPICLTLNHLTYLLSGAELESKAKQTLLQSARAVVNKSEILNSFIKNDCITRDTLNLARHEWFNLNEPQKRYNDSIPDLFQKAKSKAFSLADRCTEMLRLNKYDSLGLFESFDNGEPVKLKKKEKAHGRV